MTEHPLRAQIDAAVRAADVAALETLTRDAAAFKAAIAGRVSDHPLCAALTPAVATRLLPFAGKEHLKEAIWSVLWSTPTRPHVLRVLVNVDRERFGTAYLNGHIVIDERAGARTSALHAAARCGCIDSLRCLLELNPYLELENADGKTALACAIASLNLKIATLLIEAGADPNAGVEELGLGELSGPLAELLLKAGARTTRAVGAFFSLLPPAYWDRVIAQAAPARHWRRSDIEAAFQRIDVARAGTLLAAGADRDAAQAGALRNPDAAVAARVAAEVRGFAPSALPALVADPERLAAALRAGLDPDAQDEAGCTLLTVAARALAHAAETTRPALRRSIRCLVRAGADRTGRRGRSSPLRAFLSLAAPSHVGSLRFLLRLGLRDPLTVHFLCREALPGATTFLKLLLAAGHDPNRADASGRTPLHLLACRESFRDVPELATLLLQAGADATLKDPSGDTALDIAGARKRTRLVECLAAEARRQRAESLVASAPNAPSAPRKRRLSL